MLILTTHAGKGMLAILFAVLLILWPPSVNFAAAAFAIAYGIGHFRACFRELDAALASLREDEHEAAGSPAA